MLSTEPMGEVRPAPAMGDRELKFVLPDGRVDPARRWLDAVCQRDPRFPAAIVWTIYYDTPGLASSTRRSTATT